MGWTNEREMSAEYTGLAGRHGGMKMHQCHEQQTLSLIVTRNDKTTSEL